MNSLVKVPPYSKLNFQGKIFFTQNWCNITLTNTFFVTMINGVLQGRIQDNILVVEIFNAQNRGGSRISS
jgi:hypothetical protein